MLDAEIAPVMLAALIVFAALGGITMYALRRRYAARERELSGDLERARAELDRLRHFIEVEPQIVVVWDRADAEPRVEGEFSLVSDAMNPHAHSVLRRLVGAGGRGQAGGRDRQAAGPRRELRVHRGEPSAAGISKSSAGRSPATP